MLTINSINNVWMFNFFLVADCLTEKYFKKRYFSIKYRKMVLKMNN